MATSHTILLLCLIFGSSLEVMEPDEDEEESMPPIQIMDVFLLSQNYDKRISPKCFGEFGDWTQECSRNVSLIMSYFSIVHYVHYDIRLKLCHRQFAAQGLTEYSDKP